MLMISMLFSFSLLQVLAAEEYTYTVTFYAGNRGTFTGIDGLSVVGTGDAKISNQGDKVVVSGLKTGDIVSFDLQQGAVSLGDEIKYYVKGVRLSGRDNDTVDRSAFYVDSDEDYVVAYGIKGNMVGYTVRYEDEEGRELAPSRTCYGNIGDKPVVAYLYVENYTPQALALTKTLSANEAENVFTFVYRSGETEVVTIPGETVTVTTVVPGTTTTQTTVISRTTGENGITTGRTGTTGGTGVTAAGTGTTGGTTGTDANAGAAGTGGTEEAVTSDNGETAESQEISEGTQEIIDLDEDETPLAEDAGMDKAAAKKSLPFAAGIATGAGAIIALAVLVVLLRKHLRK